MKKQTLIIKSKNSFVKIPAKDMAESNTFTNKRLRITGNNNGYVRTIDASDIPGKELWDKAYQVVLSNPASKLEHVEPDIASNIYFNDLISEADASRETLSEFIKTYPNPGKGPQGFTWHLDDNHSQLKRANELVFPEIQYQDFPESTVDLVKIAHIDTGYLPDHPALPANLDTNSSRTFTSDGAIEGATDFDLSFAIAEQQGHGNGTLSILAGGKIQDEVTGGEFRGFFGAIPFANVLSLKISESVAILSGKNFSDAVDYAIAQKCDVITMSMAGLPGEVMADAVNRAYEHGIVIVSAAGNSFVRGIARILPETTLYPARYPQVIAAVGAAINEKPYLFAAHNEMFRSSESEFMQMNYGPDDALDTTLAAYTPNLVWFNSMEEDGSPKYFIKRGGGTSSATPQIAAAAALYIHKHRKALNQLAGKEKWMIVEMVKAALFQSASRANPYRKYYGNGVLRAADALAIEPATLLTTVTRAKKAVGGGNIFKRLFRIFTARRTFGVLANDVETQLHTMMSTEVLQLLHRDSNLHRYLDQINPNDEAIALDMILDLDEFVQDIRGSDKASEFLKQRLIVPEGFRNNNSFHLRRSDFDNHIIKTDHGSIEIRTEGITGSVRPIATDQKLENIENVKYHEFEIEISEVFASRRGGISLAVTDSFNPDEIDTVLLVEKQLDGAPILKWQIRGENKNIPASLRGAFADHPAVIESDQFFIDLGSGEIDALRRGDLKISKLLIKVFNLFKQKNRNNGNIGLDDLLAETGDSKYEILIYDLNREHPTGKEWQEPKSIRDVFKTINIPGSKPLLVLIPGLLAKVENSFDEFLSNPKVVTGLKTKFGRYVIGLNMPSLVQGIQDNATKLNQLLIDAGIDNKQCSVIARSSGGLVARYLFEEILNAANVNTNKVPLKLEKLVVTGTANQGTLLASKENWSNYVNIASNVANLVGLFVPIVPQIVGFLKAIINQAIQIHGISDLEEQSEVLVKLNQINTTRDNYLVITSNFEPNGLLKKLFNERVIDRLIFKEEDNDTLAPVRGAIFKNPNLPTTIVLSPDQFHICSDRDQVNHFSYLKPKNTVVIDKILAWI